jgi:hypothetical protein
MKPILENKAEAEQEGEITIQTGACRTHTQVL